MREGHGDGAGAVGVKFSCEQAEGAYFTGAQYLAVAGLARFKLATHSRY